MEGSKLIDVYHEDICNLESLFEFMLAQDHIIKNMYEVEIMSLSAIIHDWRNAE